MHQFQIHYVYRDERGVVVRGGDATKLAATEEQAIELFKTDFRSMADETYNPAQLELNIKVTVDPVEIATDFQALLISLDTCKDASARYEAAVLRTKYNLYFAQLGDNQS